MTHAQEAVDFSHESVASIMELDSIGGRGVWVGGRGVPEHVATKLANQVADFELFAHNVSRSYDHPIIEGDDTRRASGDATIGSAGDFVDFNRNELKREDMFIY
jgi:hypothetical protein